MNILVTAGNTQAPLDRVRCITNIFTGQTGGRIAAAAYNRGHAVTLLTSHPEVMAEIPLGRTLDPRQWRLVTYRTFDELEDLMSAEIGSGRYGAVIHSAAVSDFLVAGIFSSIDGTLLDVQAGKIKSTHGELWIKMTAAPKLVDRIRADWKFDGILVKFKLEVGISETELLAIAEKSRVHSHADLMVANTLEGKEIWALLGAGENGYTRVTRAEMTEMIVHRVESLVAAKTGLMPN
jgi:phosphopantothenate---cysteine ligase (CTP)